MSQRDTLVKACVTRLVLVLATSVIASGCIGLTAGGGAHVAVSHQGRVRLDVDAPVGVGTRFYSAVNPDDAATALNIVLRPTLTYRPDSETLGFAFGPSFGGAHYFGRVGVIGMATIGLLLDSAPTGALDDSGKHQRFFFRLNAGIELETNSGDWRIDDRGPSGFSPTSYTPRTPDHGLLGVLLGVEYVAADRILDPEWNFSLGASYRGMFEPE